MKTPSVDGMDRGTSRSGDRERKEREREKEREKKREKRNKRASTATPLSKYFYDVAAFRGSLVKKGFPFVGRDTIAKCSPARFSIAVCAAFSAISRLFEATTLSGAPENFDDGGTAWPRVCLATFTIVSSN